MKQMTYLDIILWIQENVYEKETYDSGIYDISYKTLSGSINFVEGTTLIECVLKANNAELVLEKPLDLTPRTPQEQVKAIAYVQHLKETGGYDGNN